MQEVEYWARHTIIKQPLKQWESKDMNNVCQEDKEKCFTTNADVNLALLQVRPTYMTAKASNDTI